MQIKIIKCSDSMMWYSKRVGEIFKPEFTTKEYGEMFYWCREGGTWNCINKVLAQDVEIVD